MAQRPHAKQAKSHRILVSIPEGLKVMLDQAASEDFTSRSDIIRVALLWYLRPQGRELAKTDPEMIIKTLQRRKSQAAIKKMLKS